MIELKEIDKVCKPQIEQAHEKNSKNTFDSIILLEIAHLERVLVSSSKLNLLDEGSPIDFEKMENYSSIFVDPILSSGGFNKTT